MFAVADGSGEGEGEGEDEGEGDGGYVSVLCLVYICHDDSLCALCMQVKHVHDGLTPIYTKIRALVQYDFPLSLFLCLLLRPLLLLLLSLSLSPFSLFGSLFFFLFK